MIFRIDNLVRIEKTLFNEIAKDFYFSKIKEWEEKGIIDYNLIEINRQKMLL